MHGKHSRVMFIPLYRILVCNNGIDSRKCATGCGWNVGEIEKCFESNGWRKYNSDVTKRTGERPLPLATKCGYLVHSWSFDGLIQCGAAESISGDVRVYKTLLKFPFELIL
jgi:hypothetical protein